MLTEAEEIFDLVSSIRDPEFPSTLGELGVIKFEDVIVNLPQVDLYWSPTVSHCSFAFQIALSIRVKLQRELLGYSLMKFKVFVKPGSHAQEREINK